jgi:hypothetical protein
MQAQPHTPSPPAPPPQLRDPIYASTYASVEKAITGDQPIAGSLFWKWAIPVFNKQDPRGEHALGLLRSSAAAQIWRAGARRLRRRLVVAPRFSTADCSRDGRRGALSLAPVALGATMRSAAVLAPRQPPGLGGPSVHPLQPLTIHPVAHLVPSSSPTHPCTHPPMHPPTVPPTHPPPQGPYGVLPTDTTMAYVREHAQYMKRKLNSVPPVRPREQQPRAAPPSGLPSAQSARGPRRAASFSLQGFAPRAAASAALILLDRRTSRTLTPRPAPHRGRLTLHPSVDPPPSTHCPPQRPACGLGAWFGAYNTDTQERSCVNRVKAAEAFYALASGGPLAAGAFTEEDMKLAQALRAKSTLVFPTGEGTGSSWGGGLRSTWAGAGAVAAPYRGSFEPRSRRGREGAGPPRAGAAGGL